MVDKKRTTKWLVVAMVMCWVGAAINGYMTITKFLRHDSEAWYELVGLVFFIALVVWFTRQYRDARQ